MSRPGRGLADALLAGATLVLAGIAVYCAHGLRQERSRLVPVAAAAHAVGAAAPLAVAEEETAIASVGSSAIAANATAGVNRPTSRRDAGDLAVARYRLARIDDPQGRAEEAARLGDLRREWEELATFAGLSAGEAGNLAAQAVESQLQALRAYYACQADPACEAVYPVPSDMAEEQLVRVVGTEGAGRVRAHQAASLEHQFIRLLRELPGTMGLGDADAGRLALALAEERQRLEESALQAGARVETESGPWVGYYLRIVTAPDEAGDLQRRLESAMQYNVRLYQRAAAILPAAALARFKAIQDAAVDSYRRKVEEMEVARAARRAAGLP